MSAMINNSKPILSVIVPSENRAPELKKLIASLQKSRALLSEKTQKEIELIVVDSTEPKLIELNEFDSRWMRIIPGPKNVRQKRNIGAKMSYGKWIAFVDSDCVVELDYFKAIFNIIEENAYPAWAGRIRFDGSKNFIWKIVASTRLIAAEKQTERNGTTIWGGAANLLFYRAFFFKVGKFDETFPLMLGGDDVDLGLRMADSGIPQRILEDAVVIHPTEPWSALRPIASRAWRWGRMEYHLAKRHQRRCHPIPPPFSALLICIALTTILITILTQKIILLIIPVIWALTSNALFSALITSKQRDTQYIHFYLGGFLELLFQFGTVYEHIRNASFRFLVAAPMFDLDFESRLKEEALNAWANAISFLFILIIGVVLVKL